MATLPAPPLVSAPEDYAVLPGPIHAAIAATAMVNTRTQGSIDPVERGLAAVEALWDQGYVIVEAKQHMKSHWMWIIPSVPIGIAVGVALELGLHVAAAAILLFIIGLVGGWLARGICDRR